MSVIEDSNLFDGFGANTVESSEVEELGTAIERKVMIKDLGDCLSVNGLSSGDSELMNPIEKSTCEEFEVCHLPVLNNNKKKVLDRHGTFPCSNYNSLSFTSPKMMEGQKVSMQNQSSRESRNPHASNSSNTIYSRSISLPAASELISAMKGGHGKEGLSSKQKQNVKWAPDVYDPPITLMSHTVKNRNQRPKPKKDRNKHKQKGKSSRRSGGEKKSGNCNAAKSTGPLFVSFQAPADKLLLDCYSQSDLDGILDYAVGGKESKCGSRLLIGSLAKIQFPVAEAS